MTVSFEINQAAGAGAGTPGQSRKDLWQGVPCQLVATGVPPATAVLWELLYVPSGSSAAITNPTSLTSTITPDVGVRSMRLRLTVGAGGIGNVFVFIMACSFDSTGTLANRGWRTPALNENDGEPDFGAQVDGWLPDYDKIILDLLAHGFGGVGQIIFVPVIGPAIVPAQPGTVYLVDARLGAVTFNTNGIGYNLSFGILDQYRQALVHNITTLAPTGGALQDPDDLSQLVSTHTFDIAGAQITWTNAEGLGVLYTGGPLCTTAPVTGPSITNAFNTSALPAGAGYFCYQSTTTDYTVLATDAATYSKSLLIGVTTGVPNQLIFTGVAPAVIFSTASPAPTRGSRVFLALASDTAGAVTMTAPSVTGQTVAPVGIVVGNIEGSPGSYTADIKLLDTTPVQL